MNQQVNKRERKISAGSFTELYSLVRKHRPYIVLLQKIAVIQKPDKSSESLFNYNALVEKSADIQKKRITQFYDNIKLQRKFIELHRYTMPAFIKLRSGAEEHNYKLKIHHIQNYNHLLA